MNIVTCLDINILDCGVVQIASSKKEDVHNPEVLGEYQILKTPFTGKVVYQKTGAVNTTLYLYWSKGWKVILSVLDDSNIYATTVYNRIIFRRMSISI